MAKKKALDDASSASKAAVFPTSFVPTLGRLDRYQCAGHLELDQLVRPVSDGADHKS